VIRRKKIHIYPFFPKKKNLLLRIHASENISEDFYISYKKKFASNVNARVLWLLLGLPHKIIKVKTANKVCQYHKIYEEKIQTFSIFII